MDKATLLEDEIQRVIDALQKRKDIEIEAMHNHLIKVDPVVQHPHFGAKGDAVEISRFVHDAMKLTTTPLPYVLPENSSTPLDTIAIQQALGETPDVKPDGSVEVEISRKEEIEVDGIEVPPSFGTELIVFFEPIGNGQAAIQGEFALIQSEVSDTVEKMRENGIEITALHHHETDLDPQLLHLHTFATGDEADLAQRVNRGLKHVNRER